MDTDAYTGLIPLNSKPSLLPFADSPPHTFDSHHVGDVDAEMPLKGASITKNDIP
jgi:hypothetical protein